MPPQSSYLRHLPPVLWETPSTGLGLGELLCIFEKVLTGIDDGIPIRQPDDGTRAEDDTPRRREHEPITAIIDRMHENFDPWRAPAEMLPWLASWVALEFPTHPVSDGGRAFLWEEYQRRKVTAEMAQIYRLRGLKDGLNRFLDLYAVSTARPRIAVDDGSRLLGLDVRPDRRGRLQTVVSRNPTVHRAPRQGTDVGRLVLSREGPVHPSCLALLPDGGLLLGDLGTVAGWTAVAPDLTTTRTIPPGFWRYPELTTAASATPERIASDIVAPSGTPPTTLKRPIAVLVDPGPAAAPAQRVYLLDRDDNREANNGLLFQVDPAQWGRARLLRPVPGTSWPVGMALDSERQLVILDRGTPVSEQTQPPRPILLRIPAEGTPMPLRPAFPADLLPREIEPLSLLILANGDLLIGEGGPQNNRSPGNLRLVHLQGSAWQVSQPLLPSSSDPSQLPENPLVAPVAMAEAPDGSIYVVDLGLKPYQDGVVPSDPLALLSKPFLRHRTEPAAVFRVELSPGGARAQRVSETGQLVRPSGAALAGQTLYIADQGERLPRAGGGVFVREWRAEPHQFGVVVHFPPAHEPAELGTTVDSRRQMLRTISSIVDREKPAHTDWSYTYSYIEAD